MLTFLVGTPRSGKSAWAEKYVNFEDDPEFIQPYKPRTLVNGDAVRFAVTGNRWNNDAELLTHPIKLFMIKALLATGHDVLVDDTHTSKYSIEQLWSIDPKARFVIIDTDIVECKKRAMQTGHPELIPIIDRTWPQFLNMKTYLLSHSKFLNYLGENNVYKSNC